MKQLYSFVFAFFLIFISGHFYPALAAENEAIWAKSTSTSANASYFSGVKSDSLGNTYAVGSIYGTEPYNFGNGITVTGTNVYDNLVIVKYNSSGVAQWARTVTAGTASSVFYGIVLDSDANVYAVGSISGTGSYGFGNGVTVSGANAGENLFIVKYNSSGVAQWARSTAVGPGSSNYKGVAIDITGNIYAVGYNVNTGTYDLGDGITVAGSAASNNLLIVKYNSSGVAQWARSVDGGNSSTFYGVVVDPSENIFAVGYITDTNPYDFGNGVTVSGGNSGSNGVLVMYNTSGVAQWAKSTTVGPGYSEFVGVTVDSTGNSYVVGYISTTSNFNFGNSVIVAGGNASLSSVIVKYNVSGVTQWAKSTVVDPGGSSFGAVSVATDSIIYAVGPISGSSEYDFGNGIVVAGSYAADNNIAIVKYNSDGDAQWARSTTSASASSNLVGLSSNSEGDAYVVGSINGNGSYGFGNSVTVAGGYSGGQNSLIIKYSTVVASSNSESGNTSVSTSNSSPDMCVESRPLSTPDLFQIDILGTSAKLFFTPILNSQEFYISYSTGPNAEEHGALVSLSRDGVQSFTINLLNPNKKYYFKVRGQNGCLAGSWSTILSAKSRSIWNTVPVSFYKYN